MSWSFGFGFSVSGIREVFGLDPCVPMCMCMCVCASVCPCQSHPGLLSSLAWSLGGQGGGIRFLRMSKWLGLPCERRPSSPVPVHPVLPSLPPWLEEADQERSGQ